MEEKKASGFGIPMAIVLAGAIVAGAIVYSNSQNGTPAPDTTATAAAWTDEITNTGKHLLGNATAPVTITEYSDTECPFCRSFHTTMTQIMNEYGTAGQVAWVYKHFPLDRIHPNARPEAEASECVAQISGNETFWKFLDEMFTTAPSSDRAEKAALALGVDAEKYASCTENDIFDELVDEQYKEGLSRGVQGTPHSIIRTADGQEFTINGAYPYLPMKIVIDMILAEKDATTIQAFIDIVASGTTPEQIEAFLEAEFPEALEELAPPVVEETAQ